MSRLRRMQAGEVDAVSAMLARAFHDDPGYGALFAPEVRDRALRFLFSRLLRLRLEAGARISVVDDAGPIGVLCWAPSDVRFGLVDFVRVGFGLAPFLFGLRTFRRMTAADAQAGSLRSAQQPDGPHAWIAQVGVHPDHQGKGVGRALIEHALAEIDGQALPTALMTTRSELRAYYGRFGFEVRGEAQMEGFTTWFLSRSAIE